MDEDIKREARRQYLSYFKVWFIGVGVLLVMAVSAGAVRFVKGNGSRGNDDAPKERVYDEADVLTDAEEEKLRKYIAKKEKELGADFVIRTISQPMEGQEALKHGCVYTNYEKNMFDVADTFWEEKGYGYNKDWEGDGSILLDNCYPGQEGTCISTSGKIEKRLSEEENDKIQDAIYDAYRSSPYKAYVAYIDGICKYARVAEFGPMYYLVAVLLPLIVAGCFAASHLKGSLARKTVAPNAYVVGGKPVMRDSADDFVRKHVTQRKIETSSSGGSRSSGGGGHHVSRGGASHGGSVRRR